MLSPTDDERELLAELGRRLRARRLQRNEKQRSMAARIGVSTPTYRKMERGDPSTAIGCWVRAMRLIGAPDALQETLPLSLFDAPGARQRAVARRKR